MPVHAYRCQYCYFRFDKFREFGDDVSQADCPQCRGHSKKRWDADCIGPFDEGSASPQDWEYSEQLNRMVRRGRSKDVIKEVNRENEEACKPVRLDWH